MTKQFDYGTSLREREAMVLEERAKGIRRLADNLNIGDTFTKSDRDRMYKQAEVIESKTRELRQQNLAAEIATMNIEDSNGYIFRKERDYMGE